MSRGIYKRGNMWWISYAGLDGEIIRESTKCSVYKYAETLRIKRKQEVAEGKLPEIKKIGTNTFNKLTEDYLKWAESQRCFKSKRYLIDQLLKKFRNYKLRHFNTKLIDQLQTQLLTLGKKPATVNRYLATLKHMFSKAVEWELVEEETLKKIRKVKFLPENNRRLRYLTKDEADLLISKCPAHLRPIVITALNTGMRKREILYLKWSNVDLVNGFILLTNTKNGERREIPINDTLRFTLNNIIRRIGVPYVFYDKSTGKPFNDVKKSFSTALERAKIQDFKFHDLRHVFASNLVMAGVDLMTVKELLGHKTLTMTLRYAHLAPGHKKEAVKVLDRDHGETHKFKAEAK